MYVLFTWAPTSGWLLLPPPLIPTPSSFRAVPIKKTFNPCTIWDTPFIIANMLCGPFSSSRGSGTLLGTVTWFVVGEFICEQVMICWGQAWHVSTVSSSFFSFFFPFFFPNLLKPKLRCCLSVGSFATVLPLTIIWHRSCCRPRRALASAAKRSSPVQFTLVFHFIISTTNTQIAVLVNSIFT